MAMTADRRSIGFWTAVFLVVANMIGAGVFTTSGFALADLGTPGRVLLAWVVGGVFAMCGALCYGALARRIPESGGEYVFLARTMHPFMGFLAGWVSLLAGFTAPIAVAALALQKYVVSSFGTGGGIDERWIGTVAIGLAALAHGLRLRAGVIAQNTAVIAKLLLITGFLVAGAVLLPGRAPVPSTEPAAFELGAFGVTQVWIYNSYSGWNAAVYVAGEVRDPQRNLARSLVVATSIVTVLYLGLNAVFVYAAPVEELAGKPEVGAIAAEALGGLGLRRFVAVVVAFALVTSVSSMVMAGPRVYAKMAEDGLFPAFFRMGREVPGRAVLLQALLAIVVVWISGLYELLSYVGFTLGLSSAATIIGLLRLRLREGAERVPIPGYPFTPALFLAGTLFSSGFLVQRAPTQAALGLATAVSGAVVYAAAAFLKRR
jgi:amino acid transporter